MAPSLALSLCAVVFAFAVVASCSEAPAVAMSDTCATSIADYCSTHTGACPPSPRGDGWCGWLASQGEDRYGGPVDCAGLGTGWQVDEPDGAAVSYVFDDAGSLAAIVDMRPDGGCRAGPATLPKGSCSSALLAYSCASDGGPPDAAQDAPRE